MDLPGNMSPTRREDVVSARNSCQRYSAVVANADVDLVVCWTSLIPDAVPPVKSKPFVVPFAAVFVPFVAVWVVHNAKAKNAVPPVFVVPFAAIFIFVCFVAVRVYEKCKKHIATLTIVDYHILKIYIYC